MKVSWVAVLTVCCARAAISCRDNSSECLCSRGPCVYRCCPGGEGLVEGVCRPAAPDLRLPDLPSPPALVLARPHCPNGSYLLEPWLTHYDRFTLSSDGSLFRPAFGERLDHTRFCLTTAPGRKELTAVLCFDEYQEGEDKDGVIYSVYPVGMVVSLPFLLATFLAYALLKELRNLHGKTVMSHVFSLLLGYVSLAAVQLSSADMPTNICIVAAFTIQFGFLATFFWLNVMCFDIWWTFSGLRKLGGSARETERRKFVLYSVYAWGCPVLVLAVTLLVDYTDLLPRDSPFKPAVGVQKCFFATREGTWLYFYGPMGVLLLSNILMFAVTARKILLHTRETAVLKSNDSRKHDSNDKERFYLYLKLFLVMGINWATELISWIAGGPKEVWYITDITNTLQGVFIFVIFVCKRRVLRLLCARLCPKVTLFEARKTTGASSSSSNQRTASTAAEDSLRLNNAPEEP